MNLKKILPELQKVLAEKGLSEPNELQQESWSSIKSGADCVLIAPEGSGKTTTLALHLIQKLRSAEGESTRALLIVKDKDNVSQTVNLLSELAQYTNLRIRGVHEKGDIDYDKNQISLGLDLLVGTTVKINELFASAGFNLTTIRLIAIDDADEIFKSRQEAIVNRLAESVSRSQYLFACSYPTERLEIMADKIMTEPVFFELGEDE